MHYDAEEKIFASSFDTPHGISEIREAMLGWFDLHLKNKGDGTPKRKNPLRF